MCRVPLLLVIFNRIVKKTSMKQKPFTLAGITRASSNDRMITLKSDAAQDFSFEADQFIWINTSASVHSMNEHPFSIASCKKQLPEVSMIIRESGDYTSQLDSLTIGQEVYVDGPYGSMSLLRELAANHDSRPIRLLYGNNGRESA